MLTGSIHSVRSANRYNGVARLDPRVYAIARAPSYRTARSSTKHALSAKGQGRRENPA